MLYAISRWESEIEDIKSQLDAQLRKKRSLSISNDGIEWEKQCLESLLQDLDVDPLNSYLLIANAVNGSPIWQVINRLDDTLRKFLADLYLFMGQTPNIDISSLYGAKASLNSISPYNLQAPGDVENWYSIMELGYFMAICNILRSNISVGLCDSSLSQLNKYFQNHSEEQIAECISHRKQLFEKFGVSFIDYKKPRDIEDLVDDILVDEPIRKLFSGQLAQVFGYSAFDNGGKEVNLAWQYYLSQISNMLSYMDAGEVSIHYGADSEIFWDSAIKQIIHAPPHLKERFLGYLQKIDSSLSSLGAFAWVHYQRPKHDNVFILPYTLKEGEASAVPLIEDSTCILESKLHNMPSYQKSYFLGGVIYAFLLSPYEVDFGILQGHFSNAAFNNFNLHNLISERKKVIQENHNSFLPFPHEVNPLPSDNNLAKFLYQASLSLEGQR